MINKSDSRCAVVRFCYHSHDYRLNWTPLSPITITYQQQVHIIDATDATAVNVVLKNIRNALIGAGSKVRIYRRCFRRQRVLQHSENNHTVCADGTHGSSKKSRRKLRKRSFESKEASRKCDLDGNSADGENSDSDGCEKFTDFLQYDSDD